MYSKRSIVRRVKAFTLIELLVVIAIIALLLSITMPGLRKTKEMASMINCLSNQKNLTIAFILYAEDNGGKFCSGYVPQHANRTNPPSWVMPPLAYGTSGNLIYKGNASDISLQHRLNGLREGAVYPYLNSTDVFHCPGDRRLITGVDAVLAAGASLNRAQVYRSYALPDFYVAIEDYNGIPNETRLANINGAKILFVEDQYDWYFNVDAWSYIPRSQSLWDPLGNYHNKSATFSFVAGHAENYKWRDERTMIYMSDRQLAASRGFGKGQGFNPRNEDLDWLDSYYPCETRLKGGN